MPEQLSEVVVCTRHGQPADVLEVQQKLIAEPHSGFVRVRMLAAPINPSDILFCKGNYGIGPEPPAVMGLEGVGVVESSGGSPLGWLHRGKRVAVVSRVAGTWGEYCLTEAKTVIPVPNSLSDEEAAVFMINPATALLMTRWVLQVPERGWLIQSAAASAVGRMVIRLGRHFNFRTVNIVRHAEQVDELKQLGADVVIVANESTTVADFVENVRVACQGDLPRCAIDPVGGQTGTLLFSSLGTGGRMLAYASLAEEPIAVNSRTMIVNDRHLESFWLGRALESLSLPSKLRFIRELTHLHKQGLFRVETFRTFSLQQLDSALDANSNKRGGEKILLKFEHGTDEKR